MNLVESIAIWTGVSLCAGAALLAVARLLSREADHERCIQVLLGASSLVLGLVLLFRGMHQGHFPAFGRFEVVTFYAVATMIVYVTVAWRHGVQGVSAFVAPYALLLLLSGVSAAGACQELDLGGHLAWLGVHAGTAFVSYALCTLSAMLALVYLIQDQNLKRKNFGLVFERLPSLEALDHLMSRQIGAAFFMLTISLISAVHLVRLRGIGLDWLRDPKTVATLVTWGLYAVLMHMRTSARRHGKGLALVTVLGLGLVLFSFLGIRLISDSLHNTVLSIADGPP